MYEFRLEREVAERIVDNLIRISEAYLQKALEHEAKHKPEEDTLAETYRIKSQLAAADANLLQQALLFFMNEEQNKPRPLGSNRDE